MITLQVFNNTNRLYTLLNSHTVTLICMCKQRFLPTIVRSAFFHTTYRNSVFVPSERNFFHWVGVLWSGPKICMRCDPASALYMTVLGFWYWWGKSRVSLFFNISCLQHNKTVTIKSHRSIMKSREWWRWYKTLQARTYLPYSTFNTKDAQERHTTSQTSPHIHTHTHTFSLLPSGTCLCKQQDLKTVSQACHTHVV